MVTISEYFDKVCFITIPASVTTIGNYAFADCTNLISVTLDLDNAYVGNSAFIGNLTSIYNGPGTYTTESASGGNIQWTKQQ